MTGRRWTAALALAGLVLAALATASGGTCGSGTVLTTAKSITSTASAFATGRGPVAATSGTDPLCVQLNLPPNALSSLAGTSGSVLFTFTASAGT